MLARIRPLYNKFVLPIGRASLKLGFTPDTWTFISLLLSMLAAVMLYYGRFWWGLVLVIAMFAADALDGATARAGGTTTKFGTVFDHVVDRYAEFFVIGGLLVGGWISPAAALFSASGMVMASYVRAKAESAGGLDDCAVGFAGRAEKLILTYGAIFLLALGYGNIAEYFFWAVGAISHLTAIQRLLYARARILRPLGQELKVDA